MQTSIVSLLYQLTGGNLKNTVKQIRIQAICCGIIGFSLLMALVFLNVLSFLALCLVMHPVGAATTMVFIWFFVAGLSVLLSRFFKAYQQRNYQRHYEEQHRKFMTESTLSSIAMLGKYLPLVKLGLPALGLAAYFLWQKDKKDHF
ncbi:hypothetical protein [Bartonella schoenbuchensis]|uniref:Phage holin family protein n=2 Tax=Bartonella schoenbuchensis TaxID=165694 RepID=E6Z1G4_BARSR|nr:hypothetical protein [Bartonella schoenbuchensis]AQX31345.1 hypothetical protein BscR1v2_014400 [Bartonella schoenbuchensis R1]CBI82952.1 conserved membrane hypothetical protein [Bartonella schoenbuchensis R1]CDP79445.1 hypothetical membrane protein [Bartonella schoenbuchensis]